MNDEDFTVEGTYEGNWKFSMCNEFVYGTLIIEKDYITLRVLASKGSLRTWRETRNVVGKAFKPQNDGGSKDCEFYFSLQGLQVLQFGSPSSSYREIRFDVQEVFLSIKPDIDFSAINSCIIRTELLDKWCWGHIENSFVHNINNAGCKQSLRYKQKKPYTCFRDKESKVLLYFGTKTIHPSINGFHIINKCFLNIFFNNKQNFEFAYTFAERICCFFSLLWNVAYAPEYIEFRTNDNKFIYINKSDVKCVNGLRKIEKVLFSQLTDFTPKQLNIMLKKWLELFESKQEALTLYSESTLNERLPSKNVIKNLLSVVDGLTEPAKTDGTTNNSRKRLEIETYLRKCTELTRNEKNIIKTGFLRETGSELKPRLRQLLLEMEEYPPFEYIKTQLSEEDTISNQDNKPIFEFVENVVDTRNFLTHPKYPKENIIPTKKYAEYAYILQKIAQVYLLQKINAPKDIICKICQMFP